MIISHRHRFIFLKTRKTAGTSMEIALSRFCGPDDVITPIVEEDEALRRELGYPGPQNLEVPASALRACDRLAAWLGREPLRFFNHAPAAFVRRCVDPAVWFGYFKFCFERDPFDKAISRYCWSTREQAAPPPIARFLRRAKRRQISNWEIYTERDRIAVDFVGRYENLAHDLAVALRRVGLPPELELPRAKGRFRRDARHYSQVLDPPSRALLERVCARELAAFDYRWTEAGGRPSLA
jgi:hypothetical protein